VFDKVCSVHGINHPELARTQATFSGLAQELAMCWRRSASNSASAWDGTDVHAVFRHFLGVWNLLAISSRRAPNSISAACVQAHGHAQIFGWIGTFILGIGFYSIPKPRRLNGFALPAAWTSCPVDLGRDPPLARGRISVALAGVAAVICGPGTCRVPDLLPSLKPRTLFFKLRNLR
jgi:hypothetical protein